MKVGDLVRYKNAPENGYGIVLNKDEESPIYNLFIYWISKDPKYNDYVWEREHWLEAISESR